MVDAQSLNIVLYEPLHYGLLFKILIFYPSRRKNIIITIISKS